MSPETAPAHGETVLATQRQDNWWVQPLFLFVSLLLFVIYSMWRVFEIGADPVVVNAASTYHYQSPYVSIDLTGIVPTSLVDAAPYLAFPALLVLPFPAGFRATCYWFRRSYYRSFVARPAACATEAWRGKEYKGERGMLVIQNLHRYFLYATMILLAFHIYDTIHSMFPHGWTSGFYFGIGNALLWIDIVLLSGYVLGCHALRHLVGGRLDCFSCTALNQGQHSVWKGVSILNRKHGFYAMASLFSIMLADFYIRWLSNNPQITHVLGVPA